MDNKKIIITFIILFLLSGLLESLAAETQTQTEIKTKTGMGISNNRAYLKMNVNGHKITVKSPKLSKNKYLKLVNVAI